MENLRSTLVFLLTISYVSGLKIIDFSTYYQKYFNLFYMLFYWAIYIFLLRYIVMPYTKIYSNIYHICFYVDTSTVLFSIAVGVYHNKKFRSCLKKLTIVDDTLKKLGTTTDYHKLYINTIWPVLTWIITIILLACLETIWLQNQYDYDATTAIYVVCIMNYCTHLNFINNLIVASILRYIQLKFDQINEFLRNLTRNKHRVMMISKNSMSHSHQCRFPKVANNEWLICVLMHLHLELYKISRELDSIFGVEMTVSIGCYFCWLTQNCYEILNIIFINDYMKDRILFTVLILLWCFYFMFKLLFINYICEKINIEANTTGDLINEISSSNYNIDNENILQFLLQITQTPLKFYGLGLFQFGYKVFHNFSKYAMTILVILVQMHMSK